MSLPRMAMPEPRIITRISGFHALSNLGTRHVTYLIFLWKNNFGADIYLFKSSTFMAVEFKFRAVGEFWTGVPDYQDSVIPLPLIPQR